jgi:putative flavoprotein involved in K+ transport
MTEQNTYSESNPETEGRSSAKFAAAASGEDVGFVEQGRMFERLAAFDAGDGVGTPVRDSRGPAVTDRPSRPEHFDVVVIGGGQAGLSVGHYLKQRGLRFVILDANARVGDVWRNRWDSLKLFSACRWDGLPGYPFPQSQKYVFPTKDEMGDYLEAYAAHFRLPVRTSSRVEYLGRRDGWYVVRASGHEYLAAHVVVAMSNYQHPYVPAFASEIDPEIVQLHSREYRNTGQLRAGPTLIAGAGNSGAEIAVEVAKTHKTWMAGRDVGYVPFRIDSWWGRLLCVPILFRLVFHRILTVKTPLGRMLRPKIISQGAPLIRVKSKQLKAAGVERVARVAGVRDGLPVLEDGRVIEPANIVWCTGFDAGFSFIDLPIFDEEGEPKHASGVVESEPGLYFVGLHFLHSMSSSMIHGVPRDAERIAKKISERFSGSRGMPAGALFESRA